MNAKHLTNPVTLTLALDDLGWLRNFLKDERIAAEIDHEEVASLHTDVAIRAAKQVLSHEHDKMTKIINALDEALARSTALMADAMRASVEVTAMTEAEKKKEEGQ